MSDSSGERPIAVTNNEAGERRHLVKPYAERPLVELRQGFVGCPFCGNGQFRRSRFRVSDLLELLMLRYPVRCTRCSQRQYVEVAIAFMAYPPRHNAPRPASGQETWQNWTSAEAPVQTARPLSTALGPRARNLQKLAPQAAASPADPAPRQDSANEAPAPPSRDDDYHVW